MKSLKKPSKSLKENPEVIIWQSVAAMARLNR